MDNLTISRKVQVLENSHDETGSAGQGINSQKRKKNVGGDAYEIVNLGT